MRSSNDVLNDMIKAGQWNLPPIGNDVKPDRIGFGDGRVFDVGSSMGFLTISLMLSMRRMGWKPVREVSQKSG